jgi:hypothetical protein
MSLDAVTHLEQPLPAQRAPRRGSDWRYSGSNPSRDREGAVAGES